MDARERIKNQLELFGFKIEDDNPLKLVSIEEGYEDVVLNGLLAKIKLDEVIDSLKYEDGFEDYEDFDSLDELQPDDKLLVTAYLNYADEFDMSEWSTMSVDYFKNIVNKLKQHDEIIEWYFGTNEEMSYTGEELLNCLSFKKISEEEYSVLQILFNGEFNGGSNAFSTIESLFSNFENEYNHVKNSFILIDKLKEFDWEVSIYDEEKELFQYTYTPTGETSIDDINFIEILVDCYRR